MASARNDESLNAPESLGVVIADALQEQILNNPENASQTAALDARGDMNDIDKLIFPNSVGDSSSTTTNDTLATCESTVVQTATSVIEAFDVFQSRLSSVCNQGNASIENNTSEITVADPNNPGPRSSTPTGQLQTRTSNTTDQNDDVHSPSERHIMISYHHESSFDICREMCNRLRERGYKIWMDTNNLHGSIHQGMAEAVENADIVLFCINQRYYHSEYCKKEALYTDKRHVDFIPCLFEPAYQPHGWLGIIIGDQLYIDFSTPENFDVAFEELVAEIQAVNERLRISPIQRVVSSPGNNSRGTEMMNSFAPSVSVSNPSQSDSLRTVIREFRESISQSNHDAQPMTEEEFSHFADYIRQRVFGDTSTLSRNENHTSREILEDILQHSRTQTEFLRRITEMLSSITETRTVIKLSIAFAFVWAINKFLKY